MRDYWTEDWKNNDAMLNKLNELLKEQKIFIKKASKNAITTSTIKKRATTSRRK